MGIIAADISDDKMVRSVDTIPKAEYDSMRRTIEILEDDRAMQMIDASEEAIKDGRTTTVDELKDELGH